MKETKAEYIKDYRLLAPFTTAGSGTARWTFADRGGRTYFLKEFLTPVYPPDDGTFSAAGRERRIRQCEAYFQRKTRLYRALAAQDNGNIVVIQDLFRYGTKYYVASEQVPGETLSTEMAHRLPREKLLVVMKVLIHSLMRLEAAGIVHADMKPSNILMKPTGSGFFTPKLIDFEGSFFKDDPPEDEDLQGDLVYLSPEIFLRMQEEEAELSSKVDVFALGIMFHEFLSGVQPGIPEGCDYVFEAVLNGAPLKFSREIPAEYRELIASMLRLDSRERPSFKEIFEYLSAHSEKKAVAPEVSKPVAEVRPKVKTGEASAGNPFLFRAGDL